jgi:flagellar motor component MotA
MIDFAEYCSNLDCTFTDSDRKSCLPLINKIEKYAIEASKKGLLAMDVMSDNEENQFLRIAICLVTDLLKTNEIVEILMTTIKADRPTCAELLSRLIIIRAAICFTELNENYTIDTKKPPLIKATLFAMCMGIGN